MANSSKAFISNIEKRISNEFQKKIPQFKKVHDRRANNSVSNYNSITNRSNNVIEIFIQLKSFSFLILLLCFIKKKRNNKVMII